MLNCQMPTTSDAFAAQPHLQPVAPADPPIWVPLGFLQADNAKQAAEASQARLVQLQERCAAEEARLAALQASGQAGEASLGTQESWEHRAVGAHVTWTQLHAMEPPN